MSSDILQWLFGFLLIFSSLAMILVRKPVYSALAFLLTLIILAAVYLELSADFIAVMQVLVYAGAILVMFMFVIVLFQDAHAQIEKGKPKSNPWLLSLATASLITLFIFLAPYFNGLEFKTGPLPHDFGHVETLGKNLYLNFFFPFEAITLLFLTAVIGALYIGRKNA